MRREARSAAFALAEQKTHMIDLRALLLATSATVVVHLPGQEPSGSQPGPEVPRVEAGAAKPAEVGALIRQLGAESYR